ncbi:FadR/GntR family transcriptional regulator [Microbacterium sp. A93]|uniref:FadR/GntR family transcriptional regulator n=1 Tax=Microbacterium sp. A93 TaxID=3450716 RepID=UPI003F43B4AF
MRPQKTAMLVAQRIVADIRKSGYTAGDRLPPEKTMLEQYQIGRGTLRESLRFLELQGVIALKPGPGGGPVVQQPDSSGLSTALTLLLQFENAPFRTIAESREGLEPMMARLSATRMSGEQLEELRYSVEQMGESIEDEDVFLEMNRRFHDVIAHGSGNVMFGHLVGSLLGMLDGSAIGFDYPVHRRTAVYEAHAAIYRAIADRDPTASFEAMHDHISAYSRYAERKFPELLDTPISWTSS